MSRAKTKSKSRNEARLLQKAERIKAIASYEELFNPSDLVTWVRVRIYGGSRTCAHVVAREGLSAAHVLCGGTVVSVFDFFKREPDTVPQYACSRCVLRVADLRDKTGGSR